MPESAAWGGRAVTARDWLVAIAIAAVWVAVIRPGPLSLPYFWDEADVYVPGSLWVAEHGLNASPGVFPDDYSRGHPPLLYLLAGIAFRLFGSAPAVGHLVVLPFTALALSGTYLLGTATFGRRAGVGAALLLGATPLFMSIGNMLLPELPLTALTVIALFALSRGRLLLAALCGVAAALIKETGVFVAVALSVAVLWDGWGGRGGHPLKHLAGRMVLAVLPVIALCAFFLWQRLSPAGYFIFPHHQNLLWDRPLGLEDLATVWPSLVLWHGRWIVVGAAFFWLGLVLFRWRRENRPAPGVDEDQARWKPRTSAVVAAMISLVVVNAAFFTKMFWLERYALPAHPGLMVLVCGVLLGPVSREVFPRFWRELPLVAVAATFALGLLGLKAPTQPNEEEHTFAYADVIATHRQTFESLAAGIEGEPVVLTSWPMTVELRHPYVGYIDRPVRTIHIDHLTPGNESEITAVIAPARSRHGEQLRQHARRLGLRQVDSFHVGVAQPLELYVR